MAEILQGNIPKNEADANPESARRAKLNRIFGVIAIFGFLGNAGVAYLGYQQLNNTEKSNAESASVGRLKQNLPRLTECDGTTLHTREELDSEDIASMCETLIKVMSTLGIDEDIYYDDIPEGHNRSAFVETSKGEFIVLEASPYNIPANKTQDVLLHEAIHAAYDELVNEVLENEENNIEGRADFVLNNLVSAFRSLQKINNDISSNGIEKNTDQREVCTTVWSTFTEGCFARDFSGDDTTYGHPFDDITELTASGTNLLAGLDKDASKWWFRTSLKNADKAEKTTIRQAIIAVLDFIFYVTEGQPEKIVKDYDSLMTKYS